MGQTCQQERTWSTEGETVRAWPKRRAQEGAWGEVRLRGRRRNEAARVGKRPPGPQPYGEKDRLLGAAGGGRRQAVPSTQPSY